MPSTPTLATPKFEERVVSKEATIESAVVVDATTASVVVKACALMLAIIATRAAMGKRTNVLSKFKAPAW